MSSLFIQRKQLCIDLNCEKWFIDGLVSLYGLRELGHDSAGLFLIEDVKSAVLAHAADGRPGKTDIERRASKARREKVEDVTD